MTGGPLRGDPIIRELVRHALESVVDEMALTVVRTAFSPTLRDVMDFSTAFCNPRGEMVAQGLTLPLHLGAFPDAVRSVLDKYGHDLGPGDVFILNDPTRAACTCPTFSSSSRCSSTASCLASRRPSGTRRMSEDASREEMRVIRRRSFKKGCGLVQRG
jgi:hypothetical protein